MRQILIDLGVIALKGHSVARGGAGPGFLLVAASVALAWLVWQVGKGRLRQPSAWAWLTLLVGVATAAGLHVYRNGLEFPVRIYGYGLMMVLGFLGGIWLARWRARRMGESPETITTVGLLSLVGGVVGARAAFVVERWSSQFAHEPDLVWKVMNITSGGLIYYGGLLLATAVVLTYFVLQRLPIRRCLDIVAPSLMVGLGFGRLGCLLNGCCFGGPCNAAHPLAVEFPYASRPLLLAGKAPNLFGGASVSPAYSHHVWKRLIEPPEWLVHRGPDGAPLRGSEGEPLLKAPADLSEEEAHQALALHSHPVRPAQALAAGNAFLLAALLVAFSRLRRREGQVFAVMLVCYGLGRFVLEAIRGDNPHDLLAWQLTHNQYTSILTIVIGAVLLALVQRLSPSAGPFWKDRLAGQVVREAPRANRRKGSRS